MSYLPKFCGGVLDLALGSSGKARSMKRHVIPILTSLLLLAAGLASPQVAGATIGPCGCEDQPAYVYSGSTSSAILITTDTTTSADSSTSASP